MILPLVLAGAILGAAFPCPAPACQEDGEKKPVLPNESGYVLKRARELVALSQCRDADRRTDLLLEQSLERLRERESLGTGPTTPEGRAVARGLGDSYRHLTLIGAPGTIECGAAEGRDMDGTQKRTLEQIRKDQERWGKIVSSLPPEEREAGRSVLRVADEAPERIDAARAAGLEFLKRERARRESPPARPSEPPLTPPAPSPAAPGRSGPDSVGPKPDSEGPKNEPDRTRREGPETPHSPEHHPPHPHRPHH